MQSLREEYAVVLMDNCSSHFTSAVIDLLSEARVRIVTFAPHTTKIFQVLDLLLSGVLKRCGHYQLPLQDDAGSAHFIRKVYRDSRFTMTDINIWKTFRGIRVIYSVVDEIQCVSFNEIILRESDGFRELWDIDFPVESRSTRRRNARFGWINRPE
jgi:hypothetical protein